jgi:hypothetical protein
MQPQFSAPFWGRAGQRAKIRQAFGPTIGRDDRIRRRVDKTSGSCGAFAMCDCQATVEDMLHLAIAIDDILMKKFYVRIPFVSARTTLFEPAE